jgi:hypothetical protein
LHSLTPHGTCLTIIPPSINIIKSTILTLLLQYRYFFTPNSVFEGSSGGGSSNSSSSGAAEAGASGGRAVLRDVSQESLSPKGRDSSSSSGGLRRGQLAAHNKQIGSSSSSSSGGSSKGGNSNKKGKQKHGKGGAPYVSADKENGGYSPLPDTPNTMATTSPDSSSVSKASQQQSRFVPVPSFVIKATVDNYNGVVGSTKTVYVNVCKHGSVPAPTSTQLRSDDIGVSYVVGEVSELSRGGESCLAVDVCYHNQVHVWAYADENGMNLSALAEHAAVSANRAHGLNMWIASLPQYTTYHGNVKPLEMKVRHGPHGHGALPEGAALVAV